MYVSWQLLPHVFNRGNWFKPCFGEFSQHLESWVVFCCFVVVLLLLLLLCFLFVCFWFVVIFRGTVKLLNFTCSLHFLWMWPSYKVLGESEEEKKLCLLFWMWVFWALVVLLCQYTLLFTYLKMLSFSIQNLLPFISDYFFIQSMTASTHICLPGPCLSVCGSVSVCLSVQVCMH